MLAREAYTGFAEPVEIRAKAYLSAAGKTWRGFGFEMVARLVAVALALLLLTCLMWILMRSLVSAGRSAFQLAPPVQQPVNVPPRNR